MWFAIASLHASGLTTQLFLYCHKLNIIVVTGCSWDLRLVDFTL